jgi:hypothetical protein
MAPSVAASFHVGTGVVPSPSGGRLPLSILGDEAEREAWTLVSEDGALSRGILYRPRGRRPKVGIHLLRPRADFTENYAIAPLVRAGYMALGCESRWPNNDMDCIHEVLLLDVAAGVNLLRSQGAGQVVLLGNSGGSSLAPFYQAQASAPAGSRLTDTPGGRLFDLNQFHLPAADAIVLYGEHLGEGQTLIKMLDPSVADEGDPFSIEPSLDMYDFDNGFRIPPQPSSYSKAFIDEYREAQRARSRRIDDIARRMIDVRSEASAGRVEAPAGAAGACAQEQRAPSRARDSGDRRQGPSGPDARRAGARVGSPVRAEILRVPAGPGLP